MDALGGEKRKFRNESERQPRAGRRRAHHCPHVTEKGQVAGRWPQKQTEIRGGKIGVVALFNANAGSGPPFLLKLAHPRGTRRASLRGPKEIGPPSR